MYLRLVLNRRYPNNGGKECYKIELRIRGHPAIVPVIISSVSTKCTDEGVREGGRDM